MTTAIVICSAVLACLTDQVNACPLLIAGVVLKRETAARAITRINVFADDDDDEPGFGSDKVDPVSVSPDLGPRTGGSGAAVSSDETGTTSRVERSSFEDRQTELYYLDDGYIHFNLDAGWFKVKGIVAEFESLATSVGIFATKDGEESFVSIDYEPTEGIAVSGFKVGADQYGVGLGTGVDAGFGYYGLGAHGEIYGMWGDGKYEVGLMGSASIVSGLGQGDESKIPEVIKDHSLNAAAGVIRGHGVFVSVEPEVGGSTIRAYVDLVRDIKSMTGYYTACPLCP